MNRCSIVLVCLALVAVCFGDKPEIQTLEADIQIVDDIEVYRAQFPDVKLVPLDAEVQPLGQIRYTLGQRIQGDRIVAQGNNNLVYPTLQDVRINLHYPQSGIGAVVTFVEVVVDQTSNDGNAFIAAGGIGQRSISVIVEAKRTLRFAYRAAIFGY